MRHCTGAGVVIPELGSNLDNPPRVPLHDPTVDAGTNGVGARVEPLWSPRCSTRLAILRKIRRRITIRRHLQSSQPEMRSYLRMIPHYEEASPYNFCICMIYCHYNFSPDKVFFSSHRFIIMFLSKGASYAPQNTSTFGIHMRASTLASVNTWASGGIEQYPTHVINDSSLPDYCPESSI